ncbi:MAG TPA: hypothetical protein VGD35_03820 [Chitinophaga sp.]
MKKQSARKLNLGKVKIASLTKAKQKAKDARCSFVSDACQSEMNDCFSKQIEDCTTAIL